MPAPMTADPKTISMLITWAQHSLDTSGSMNAAQEALWLLAYALGMKHHELTSRRDQAVLGEGLARAESVVSRRIGARTATVHLGDTGILWPRLSCEFVGVDSSA